jgi:hypothetical protein
MPIWIVTTLIASGVAAAMSFWGWLAVKVIDQGRKLVELEGRMTAQEKRCCERLEWLRSIDDKVSVVGENVAKICGKLDVEPHHNESEKQDG